MSAMIIPLPNAQDALPHGHGLQGELRRAKIRIAQLETSLNEAMRDNLANYNRAREAERRLAELKD